MTDFNDIYTQYFKDVYKYALSLCKNKAIAEDITQETFFKALKSIDSFNGKCKLRVWLCQIAKNTYFSFCEKEKKHFSNSITEETPDTEGSEQKLINNVSAFEIHKLLHILEEPYKEVFTLRIFGELSFSQIGELFGKTESWARVTFHRAKLKLKEDLS
ncbi:MAG: sigma-70 family RNA polymerase sigma factor [Lachnospiraceae bacterium]|nr:sigma-70 family RNA polymerase sigma factor [Lachnospiraceae bacterium]